MLENNIDSTITKLFRGIELSDIEINEMIRNNIFYIPSFTSTSYDFKKCFNNKNTIIYIENSNLNKYGMNVVNYSQYNESEVLLNCYNKYEFIKEEYINGKE